MTGDAYRFCAYHGGVTLAGGSTRCAWAGAGNSAGQTVESAAVAPVTVGLMSELVVGSPVGPGVVMAVISLAGW